MQLFLKILTNLANSVNPNQTAPSGAVLSESALFAYAILSEPLVYKILGHLPYNIFQLPMNTVWSRNFEDLMSRKYIYAQCRQTAAVSPSGAV